MRSATASVVIALGHRGAQLRRPPPDWLDPLMGRIVGLTLVALGLWVIVFDLSLRARHGEAFRLRSRWMLVFDTIRYGWRRFRARLHGHEHVEPLEMSSYGAKTSFGVGMIHGIGAETGTQVLLIAAVGGAASAGLGIPMLFAFVIGLLMSNLAIVLLSSVGFVASQRASGCTSVSAPWPGCSASSSGRSSCSVSTGRCRIWVRSCRSSRPGDPGRARRGLRRAVRRQAWETGVGAGAATGRALDRPQEEGQDDHHVGEPDDERGDLGRRGVAEQRRQELAEDAAARRLVRQDGRDVEECLCPDVDDTDLDQLVDGPAEKPRRDEDEGNAGPPEEGGEGSPGASRGRSRHR